MPVAALQVSDTEFRTAGELLPPAPFLCVQSIETAARLLPF